MAVGKSHAKDWRGLRPVHSAHSRIASGAKRARLPTAANTSARFAKCIFSQTADVRDYSPITWRAEQPNFWAKVRTRTVRADMLGLHIGFRTMPRPVPTEPDQGDRESSTPEASFSRPDRILFTSGDRAPSASVA